MASQNEMSETELSGVCHGTGKCEAYVGVTGHRNGERWKEISKTGYPSNTPPPARRIPKLQGRAVSLGNSPVSLLLPSRFLLPLAAVVPAASPRLPSQEARVSLGSRLPLGEASVLCALQLGQLSGRQERGSAPPAWRAKLGRRERLGGGVRRTGGRGALEPRSRAPWSAAEELLPPTGS